MWAVFGRLEVTHTHTINTYYIIGINDVLSQLKVCACRPNRNIKTRDVVFDLQCALLWRPRTESQGNEYHTIYENMGRHNQN